MCSSKRSKANNGNFENIGYMINVSSEKKWVKTVNKINSLMKSEFELQLGFEIYHIGNS